MKIKILFPILCVAFITASFGQEKYATKNGELIFEASVPSFEEVKATNRNVSAVLDTSTGNFAALALVKGFRFKVALMEEHFNENYIESSKYPKATFKGKIENFNISEVSGNNEYVLNGILNLHGVDKAVEIPATFSKKDELITINATFLLKPEQFNIKIPSIVSKKIADEIEVSLTFQLQKQ